MYGTNPLVAGAATTAAGTGLAFTGAHVVGLAMLAVGLLLVGLTMLGLTLTRRRHRAVPALADPMVALLRRPSSTPQP